MRYTCRRCGAHLANGQLYCARCGAPVMDARPASQPRHRASSEPEYGKNILALRIISGAAAFVTGIAFIVTAVSDPVFWNSMVRHWNYSAAYRIYHFFRILVLIPLAGTAALLVYQAVKFNRENADRIFAGIAGTAIMIPVMELLADIVLTVGFFAGSISSYYYANRLLRLLFPYIMGAAGIIGLFYGLLTMMRIYPLRNGINGVYRTFISLLPGKYRKDSSYADDSGSYGWKESRYEGPGYGANSGRNYGQGNTYNVQNRGAGGYSGGRISPGNASEKSQNYKYHQNQRKGKGMSDYNNYNNYNGYVSSEDYTPISMWGYFGYELLFSIPCVGFVLLLVFSFGGTKNVNLRNFARSYFCFIIIMAVVSAILILAAGGLGALENLSYQLR